MMAVHVVRRRIGVVPPVRWRTPACDCHARASCGVCRATRHTRRPGNDVENQRQHEQHQANLNQGMQVQVVASLR